jgi:hypothetical protein
MTGYDELFPSRWLTQDDVRSAPGGRLVTVIANVTVEEISARTGGRESKPVVHFYRHKPLVLNRGNGEFLKDCLGSVIEDWRGAKIALEVVRLDRHFGGHSHGIRVTAAEPGATPSARQPRREPDLIDQLVPEREKPSRDPRDDIENPPF